MKKASRMPRPISVAEAIYRTARWKRVSKQVRSEEPVCCDPLGLHIGVIKPTEHCDHIISINKNRDLAFSRDNLRGVCRECNQALKFRV